MQIEFQRVAGSFRSISAMIRSVVVNDIDRSEASSIDNWREVGGSFERVIGPGSWNKPGLKGDL
jgi:hypothetical protein